MRASSLRSNSSSAGLAVRPPYQTSSKMDVALCRSSASAGSWAPASRLSSAAVRPGLGSSTPRCSSSRAIARNRSRIACAHSPSAANWVAARRWSSAVVSPAAEDRQIRSTRGVSQATDAHEDHHHDGRQDRNDEQQAERMPRCVAGACLEQFHQLLQKPLDAAVDQRWIVSVVAAFRQLRTSRGLRAVARYWIRWARRRQPVLHAWAHDGPAHHVLTHHV